MRNRERKDIMNRTSEGKPSVMSLGELFSEKAVYHIPIYQRAYAWGEDEIVTLLNDIRDAWRNDSVDGHPAGKPGHYYLGSLVTHRTSASGVDDYGIVDGQQRLTTLFILMCVLKSWVAKEQPDFLDRSIAEDGRDEPTLRSLLESVGTRNHFRLVFDSRELSNELLDEMSGVDVGKPWEPHYVRSTIVDAYAVITQYLLSGKWDFDKPHGEHGDSSGASSFGFWTYLFTRVLLVRDELPVETDLNHYFEIMNTRGRQLQTHEIVKARLMSGLGDDDADRTTFSTIWDACASMDGYIQSKFKSSDMRSSLFGKDWCTCPSLDWDTVKSLIVEEKEANSDDSGNGSEPPTLKSILDNITSRTPDEDGQGDRKKKDAEMDDSSYGSIIDFPNFLLHVLNIVLARHRKGGDGVSRTPLADNLFRAVKEDTMALDDKALLTAFKQVGDNAGDDRAGFAKEFVCTLLGCRFLFDNYIIKTDRTDARSDDDSNWVLQRYINSRYAKSDPKSSSSYTFLSSFGSVDDDEEGEGGTTINQGILMLQAMYQVTETGRTHKNFLQAMLRELFDEAYGQTSAGDTGESESAGPSAPNAGTFRRKIREYAERQVHSIMSGDVANNGIDDVKGDDWANRGVGTSHFLLNFLDYVLWSCLVDKGTAGELFEGGSAAEGEGESVVKHISDCFAVLKDSCDEKGGKFRLDASAFRFRYRTSVEHFYPQNPAESKERHDNEADHVDGDHVSANHLNSIGNLCLMSRSENSLRSNLPPTPKVEAFGASSQSLKFQFMAGELVKAGKWADKQVDTHTEEVRKVLKAVRNPS